MVTKRIRPRNELSCYNEKYRENVEFITEETKINGVNYLHR